jgi:hypothetical protein
MSFNDAKSKLLGFLVAICLQVVYLAGGHWHKGTDDADETEVDTSSDAHSSSPSADSQPDSDLADRLGQARRAPMGSQNGNPGSIPPFGFILNLKLKQLLVTSSLIWMPWTLASI